MANQRRIGAVLLLVVFGAWSGAWCDSLFSKKVAANGTLISEMKRRFEVGDLVTVVVREDIDARTQSNLDTQKDSTIDSEAKATDNAFPLKFIDGELLPNWVVETQNEHQADGETQRRNQLTLTIACVVTKVYGNGNLYVEGKKRMTVNREDTNLVVEGLVRTRDITSQNTVDSNQIANLTIALQGRGPLWNNQRRGFFTKLLDWISPN